MRKENIEICQRILNQTRSIDHTAELMRAHVETEKWMEPYMWVKEIVKHVKRGDLII